MPHYEGTASEARGWPGVEYLTVPDPAPCCVCATETDRVEICFEAFFCSTACYLVSEQVFFSAMEAAPSPGETGGLF